jgi:hypothetical protein
MASKVELHSLYPRQRLLAAGVLLIAAAAVATWWVQPRAQYGFTFDDGRDAELWGEYVSGEAAVTNHPKVGVTHECGGVASDPTDCRLAFTPARRKGPDAYVAVVSDQIGPLDRRRTIRAEVAVPAGAETCPDKCSTAKIFVWDARNQMREGDYAELKPGRRWAISIDPRGENWPDPFLGFGVHVYYVNDEYMGPVGIDDVTIEWRPDGRPVFIVIASLALAVLVWWWRCLELTILVWWWRLRRAARTADPA